MEAIVDKLLDKPDMTLLILFVLSVGISAVFVSLNLLVRTIRNGRKSSQDTEEDKDDCNNEMSIIESMAATMQTTTQTLAAVSVDVGKAVVGVSETQRQMHEEQKAITENNRVIADTASKTAQLVAKVLETLQSVNTQTGDLAGAIRQTNETVKQMSNKTEQALQKIIASNDAILRTVETLREQGEKGVKLDPEAKQLLTQILRNQETIITSIRSQEETQESQSAQDAPKAAKEAANHE